MPTLATDYEINIDSYQPLIRYGGASSGISHTTTEDVRTRKGCETIKLEGNYATIGISVA